ncbi:MAG: sigma-70 family RNA polymerase sigma factor [Deinococcaceae bacterium]
MSEWSDKDLVALARKDPNAFEDLMRRHGPRVAALARSLVGESHVDDVVQEVFISVYKGLKHFRGDAEFSTWIHRIALNACYAKLKRPTAEALEHDVVSAISVQKNAEQQQLRELIELGMQKLPLEQREAFALREFSGLDYDAIAQILECQLGTVKSRIARAKTSLKAFLMAKGVCP